MGKKMSEGRDKCKRVDEPEEAGQVDFWKNPDNICRLLDLLYLGREDEPPVGLPS